METKLNRVVIDIDDIEKFTDVAAFIDNPAVQEFIRKTRTKVKDFPQFENSIAQKELPLEYELFDTWLATVNFEPNTEEREKQNELYTKYYDPNSTSYRTSATLGETEAELKFTKATTKDGKYWFQSELSDFASKMHRDEMILVLSKAIVCNKVKADDYKGFAYDAKDTIKSRLDLLLDYGDDFNLADLDSIVVVHEGVKASELKKLKLGNERKYRRQKVQFHRETFWIRKELGSKEALKYAKANKLIKRGLDYATERKYLDKLILRYKDFTAFTPN